MFVIGTAGHVDHGKSALIEALTGTHPDRLKEEQERGLTIELGFGWLTLPSGREISIVDVPGHVRFVRHMLAGAGAIDLALLVVAADEGIMPQTREHLDILDLLEVRHAIVALTKCDLVEDDWADLVEEEVRELLEPTALAGARVVRVSSVTGRGLEELREALDRALDRVPEPEDIGRPRLGIDRVFTMAGFGTVVTGTLLGGRLRVGDTLEAVPGGPTARVRGLQTHRRTVEEAQPGTRVAVNLAGVTTEDLARGQVLAPPGRVPAALTLDARLRVLDHRAVRHNLRGAVHLGTAEVQGRVRVIGGDEIARGEEGWCQLVLSEPLAAVPGDLFVLRVSDETVTGGRVIEVNAPRHRRHDARTVERMAARAEGTPESRLLAALERAEPAAAAGLAASVEVDAGQVGAS
ncbi:MAG: selenocysteine-specific translation elongation factor, partial [Chloroflexi bacterium]|nr:selenocysteine-specific translation elongation factor [Chloroflexota bacterium]